MSGRPPGHVDHKVARDKLEQAAVVLTSANEPRYARLDALATLLTAFAIGSRTATRALEEYRRRFPTWRMPQRSEAMAMAHEAFREAEALKAAHQAGDTLPGF